MKNLKEFKELIEKYKSITIEQIEALSDPSLDFGFDSMPIMKLLTGFGYTHTCSLCMAVRDDCNECVWYHINKLIENIGAPHYPCLGETYYAIELAKSPQELLIAIANRVKFMETKLRGI